MAKIESSPPKNRGIPRVFRLADFALGLASIGVGAYEHSLLWIALGIAGLALAWLDFSATVWAFVLKRFRTRTTAASPPPSGFPAPPAVPYARQR